MALFGGKKKEAKKESAKRVARARALPLQHGKAHEVVRAPWFSEKALLATEKGVYAFEVDPRATKAMIAGAIKEIYNVAPRAVRVATVKGKTKSMRTRRGEGMRASRKKAFVYLNSGDSIQFA